MTFTAGYNLAILTSYITVITFFNLPLQDLTIFQQQDLTGVLAIPYSNSLNFSHGYFAGIQKLAEDNLGPIDTPYLTPRQLVQWFDQDVFLNAVDNNSKTLKYCFYYPLDSKGLLHDSTYCYSSQPNIDIQVIAYPYDVDTAVAEQSIRSSGGQGGVKVIMYNTQTNIYNSSTWSVSNYPPNDLGPGGSGNTTSSGTVNLQLALFPFVLLFLIWFQ